MMQVETVGRPMEVLLVEDSLTSARLTIGALRNGGIAHRLTWLKNGEDAIHFIRQQGRFRHAPRPDLILLDLGLPLKDGREVLADIRCDEVLRTIPVVVLTASTDPYDVMRSQELDVEGYMTKPVDLDKFLNLIRELSDYWHADMLLPAMD